MEEEECVKTYAITNPPSGAKGWKRWMAFYAVDGNETFYIDARVLGNMSLFCASFDGAVKLMEKNDMGTTMIVSLDWLIENVDRQFEDHKARLARFHDNAPKSSA
ncbi:MAG TPA: hypothetical protein VKX17_27330 [Planctomycetota bacterium]|nr:hypothetical protein [Planctomycetota bacterium]